MGRSAAAGALAVLVVLPLLVTGVSTAAGFAPQAVDLAEPSADRSGSTSLGVAARPASRTQQTFARSTVEVTVYENGSARWTFTYVRPLRNESQRDSFATYAERFNAEETDLYRSFVADSEAIVARGANATGREMRASSFDRRAWIRRSLGNDLGVVAMSFTWEGFAETTDDQVIVGDVFEGGLYLGPDQTLIFHPGPGLVFVQVLPDATQSNASSLRASDSVTWAGERQFTDNRPYVVLQPPASSTGTRTADPVVGSPDGSPASSPGTDGSPSGSGLPGGMVLFGVVLAVAVAVLGVGWVHGTGTLLEEVGLREEAATGGGATDPAGTASAGAGDDGEAAAEAGAGSVESGTATAGVADERLLSDEGRVVALLEGSGGQLKQSEIVEETGWSKSKVSMLLSEMADEGRVEKLRLGRENVITLVEDGAGPDGHGPGDDAGHGSTGPDSTAPESTGDGSDSSTEGDGNGADTSTEGDGNGADTSTEGDGNGADSSTEGGGDGSSRNEDSAGEATTDDDDESDASDAGDGSDAGDASDASDTGDDSPDGDGS